METSIIPQYERLGVNFSGGTDSTLLLYMLNISHPNTELIIYTGTREDDGQYNIPYTKNVLDVLQLTNLKQHVFGTWKNRAHGREERDAFRASLNAEYQIQAWANGFTLNPKVYLGSGRDKRRDVVQEFVSINNDNGYKTYRPFVELTKKHIADRYNSLGIRDTLLPLTISCEAMSPPRPCQLCYNCREKYWGFGEY